MTRSRLLRQGHKVFGVGLGGPDLHMDFCGGVTQEKYIFDLAEQAFGTPAQVLINNAGLTHIDFLENHSNADFIRIINANLLWPFALCREFVCRTKKAKAAGGQPTDELHRIINVTSIAALTAHRGSPGYCASKSGLESLTRVIARETAGTGIVAFSLGPNGIEGTQMLEEVISGVQRTRGMTREQVLAYNFKSPLGRNCHIDEVWKMIDFLVNQAPEYCTGHAFYMPGGQF